MNEEFEIFLKYAISSINNHKFLDADKFKITRELKGFFHYKLQNIKMK